MHAHAEAHADDDDTTGPTTAREWWEARYGERDGIWSGRVNAVLASVTADLVSAHGTGPRRALDLGCGEGGDVVWLAQQGWAATGVDLSSIALDRARVAAISAGVADRTRFDAADLSTWDGAEPTGYDLVTASFLQSWPVEIPRAAILRRATGFVARGGSLLVTAHAAPPHGDLPPEMQGYRFPTPEQDLEALGLDDGWDVVVAERRPRTVTTEDGHTHDTADSVVLVLRH